MIIRTKAPFRISFGGGGTDMAPYCSEHGGCVINTTIDRHVHVSLKLRNDKKIKVILSNYNKSYIFDIGDTTYQNEIEIFKATVNILNVSHGFDIITYSDLPTGSGMGGSSALTVALIGAFDKFYQWDLTRKEIAEKAYYIERVELNQKGGYQDQYASSFGGFNFIQFSKVIEVIPVNANPTLLNELHFRLILCYIGGSHFSSSIQEDVLEKYKIKKKSFLDAMEDLKRVAQEMRDLLEANDITELNRFGELLHEGWLAKKSLSSKISNENIERFYLHSRNHGVIGGKLLGAGGGGHLLLFSDPAKKYNVMHELEKIGGKVINFHFNPKGLETWVIS
ncbi:MAG: GHMP family kinase ATP-binding protein [Promethearchaeota archaeon]